MLFSLEDSVDSFNLNVVIDITVTDNDGTDFTLNVYVLIIFGWFLFKDKTAVSGSGQSDMQKLLYGSVELYNY